MRAWLRLLVLLVAAVALALWLRDHGGSVILAVPPWRIQFSTTLGVVLLIALFIALHWALRALTWLGAVPTRLRHWRGQRAQQRDHDLFERGWVSLMAGDTVQAERDLTRLIGQTRVPSRKVIAALAAARAVHARGQLQGQEQVQHERAQTFLTTAADYMGQDPALARAVAATSAEILLDAGQPVEALARLTAVPDSQHPPHFSRLLVRAVDALGQHEQVLTLARQGLRRGWLARNAATVFIDRAGAAVLRQAASQGKNEETDDAWLAVWKDFKTEERALPRIALAAAGAYAAADKTEDAARVLEAAIKPALAADSSSADLTAELLTRYAHCDASQVSRRLTKAETWLTAYPDHPDLLCALATLCLTGQIWGAAERYLQRSLHAREDARAHALLGSLYDRLGRAIDASHHWQQAAALGMALPVLAMDAPLPAADTHADPVIPDAEAPSGQVEDDAAASPAATPPSTYQHPRPAPSAAVLGASATPLQRADIEDLFDSAPIPGLNPAGLDPAGPASELDASVDPASR